MEGKGGPTSNRVWIKVLAVNDSRIPRALKEITASLGKMRVSMHKTAQEMKAIRRTSAENIKRVERRIVEAQE